jgi:SSS family solute:Na+ symporter
MQQQAAHLLALDIAVIIAYLVGVEVLGVYFMRKSRTVEGFTLGGRSIPGWALGMSVMATFLSSVTFLGVPGKAYTANWSSYVFSLTIPVACLISSMYFIPLYRRKLQTTAYEHLEHRFGYWARVYSGFSLIMLQIGRIAAVIFLLAKAMGALLGWETNAQIAGIIIGLGILTVIYCSLGGFAAVVWTDVVQSFVLLGGVLVCVVVILFRIPGGAGQIFAVADENDKFSFGGWDFNFAMEAFWVVFLYGFVENIKNFGVDQNYVQRFVAAESDREARKSLWLGGLIYVPVSALFFFIGTALFAYYRSLEQLPEGFPSSGDNVFPFFIVRELPVGVTGLVIAAILAAGMSTLSSSINSSATVWIVDFYKRLIRPNAEEKGLLMSTRISTLVIGILGTFAGIAMIGVKSALDAWWQISAVFGGGMLGLFLLGILVPRATPRGAVLGVLAAVVVIAWGTFATSTLISQKVSAGSQELAFEVTSPYLKHYAKLDTAGFVTTTPVAIVDPAGKEIARSAPDTANPAAKRVINFSPASKGEYRLKIEPAAGATGEGGAGESAIRVYRDAFPFHKFLVGFAGTLALLAVGLIDSLIAPRQEKSA